MGEVRAMREVLGIGRAGLLQSVAASPVGRPAGKGVRQPMLVLPSTLTVQKFANSTGVH